MFDFFDEIIEYLNQAVTNSNYISNLVGNLIGSSADTVKFVGKLSLSLPAFVAWVFPAALVALIIDYIRGR